MRRLSIALTTAVAAAGLFAAPVGGGSNVTKPEGADEAGSGDAVSPL
jgi:hypothetical protein